MRLGLFNVTHRADGSSNAAFWSDSGPVASLRTVNGFSQTFQVGNLSFRPRYLHRHDRGGTRISGGEEDRGGGYGGTGGIRVKERGHRGGTPQTVLEPGETGVGVAQGSNPDEKQNQQGECERSADNQ